MSEAQPSDESGLPGDVEEWRYFSGTDRSGEIGTPAIAAAVGGALRYVAGLTHARGREDEAREWYEIAAEVEQHDYSDSWCCPLCEELTCDSGCPLEPLRREADRAMQSGRSES